MNDQEIDFRLYLMHQFFPLIPVVAAPFHNTFPAISVLSSQRFFWLEFEVFIIPAGQHIYNTADHDLIRWSLAYNPYRFHKSVGTPPSLPLIHSLDKD